MTTTAITGPYDLATDLKALSKQCRHMARALKVAGMPGPRAARAGFDALVRIIAGQQVSVSAAAGIWAKLEKNCGGKVTAQAVLDLGETGLRASGFSGQKTRYALGLAEAAAGGALDFKALHKADNDTVRGTLTAYKGVGDWTADIYLMFCMGRGDVWPAADLGLQAGIQMLQGLKKRPTAKETEVIAETWRPYRSSAAVLLWHYYGFTRAADKSPLAGKKGAKKKAAPKAKAKAKAKTKAKPKRK
jgi:DNA-3-methyladenine glycosylase II